MDKAFLIELRARRPQIRERWEALLRIEKINTPLANPDTLVYLIDWTLDDLLARLEGTVPEQEEWRSSLAPSVQSYRCQCGRNPYVAYFKAASQALMETLVLSQSELPLLDPIDRDLTTAELRQVLDLVAHNEMTAFCALCVHSPKSGSSMRSTM